ncbi:hypothetical protein MMC07_009196 [Pseudocyphellaria aurata]|nr:hypothetical protein [Pseudocyphellaria aurata]
MSITTASAEIDGNLPYWLVNVPKSDWPEECPDFLINISERNKLTLSTPDSQYSRLTWNEVREYVRTNRIDVFTRLPSEERRYLAYVAKLKKEHGSVLNFIIEKRLQWSDREPKDTDPFNNPDTAFAVDLKILYNDWPYGIDTKIIHLVVWTKFELEDDPATGQLVPSVRQQIDDFVGRTFRSRVPGDNVVWFKNWMSLRSVNAIEHFHVMLHDPDMEFIKEITHGDIPASQSIQ